MMVAGKNNEMQFWWRPIPLWSSQKHPVSWTMIFPLMEAFSLIKQFDSALSNEGIFLEFSHVKKVNNTVVISAQPGFDSLQSRTCTELLISHYTPMCRIYHGFLIPLRNCFHIQIYYQRTIEASNYFQCWSLLTTYSYLWLSYLSITCKLQNISKMTSPLPYPCGCCYQLNIQIKNNYLPF